MKALFIKIMFFCWLLNTAVASSSTDSQALVQLLKWHTYQAGFVSYELGDRQQLLKQKGRFYLKKNQGVRWEVSYPTEQIITLSGKVLRIWDVDLMQISDQSVDQAFNPSMLLSKQESIQKTFKVSRYQGTGYQSFILVPLKKMSFQSIRLDFNSKKQMVQMVVNTGVLAGELFKFNHILIDQPIKNSMFHVKVPKSVEYINRVVSS